MRFGELQGIVQSGSQRNAMDGRLQRFLYLFEKKMLSEQQGATDAKARSVL